MSDFLLFLGSLAMLGIGYYVWSLGHHDSACTPAAPVRRREDARDWQRRFGADSQLAASFLQPTQNEVLETLSVLDHLTPGWETGEQDLIKRIFLNELAVSFPSLRKAKCAFPQPFAETLTAKSEFGSGRGKRPMTEAEVAARRESFRIGRVQANAREQIVAGAVHPAETMLDGPPLRASVERSSAPDKNPWPAVLAVAAVVIAALLGISYLRDGTSDLKKVATPRVEPSSFQTTVLAEPVLQQPALAKPAAVAFATQIPQSVAVPPPVAVSTPSPTVARSVGKAALTSQIAASQQRAVSKFPALAVEGSEINLRFVFRYKNLLQENSPRLLDPTWPEQLVEECAAAATSSKHGALTQVNGARH